MAARRSKWAARGGYASDRLANPLIALQSAPGGGKSALLDMVMLLCHHSKWTEELCPDKAMLDILNNAIAVPITYNNKSNPQVDGYDSNVEHGLALRILHSFFAPAMLLGQFARAMASTGRISAADAVNTCLLAARQAGKTGGIVLLVDELVKLYAVKSDARLLADIGQLLNSFPPTAFNCVVTTLDSIYIDAENTTSGRPIAWAPLPPIDRHHAEAAMLAALKRLRPTVAELPLAVRHTISDTAGHPRSLQYAMEAMLELQPQGKHTDLQALRDATLRRLNQLYRSPPLPHVLAALRGQSLPLDEVIPGTEDTLRRLITSGAFINTDVNDFTVEVVPKLSMLRLLQMKITHDPIARSIRRCVNALARVEAAAFRTSGVPILPPRITLTGDPFERFVATWLQLMSIVRAGEVLTTLALFHVPYELQDEVPAGSPLLARFQLTPVSSAIAFPTKFSDTARASLPKKACWVARFGDSNPAFDVLLVAPQVESRRGPVVLALEARISDASTVHVDGRAKDKIKLFASIKREVAGAISPKAQVVYVYAAARMVKDIAAVQREQLKKGVLVLGHEGPGQAAVEATMQDAFTPTLADRAFFLREVSQSPSKPSPPQGTNGTPTRSVR